MNENNASTNGIELPLDLDHVPADMQEAIEMLRRAKERIADLEIALEAERDLSGTFFA